MSFYAAPYLYEDSWRPQAWGTAGDQTVNIDLGTGAGEPDSPIIVGDVPQLLGSATGGRDHLTVAGFAPEVIGDALSISGNAHGGNDQLVVHGTVTATTYGDALKIGGNGVGGNDYIQSNTGWSATAFGDAGLLKDHARGGNDTMTGSAPGSHPLVLYGDAETLQGSSRGGDDFLVGSGSTIMYGDGALTDNAVGGNDTLVCSGGLLNSRVWGDGPLSGHARGGADLFIITPTTYFEHIADFQPGVDHVELKGFSNLHSFADVQAHLTESYMQQLGGVVLDTAGTGSGEFLIFDGLTASQLHAGDFLLA